MPTKTTKTIKNTKVTAKKVIVKSKPATKVVDKKTVIKPPQKRVMTKPVEREALVYADDETSFWVSDGKVLNSLVALHEALAVMDTATFNHHINADKNDFAEWVKDVLGDVSCAGSLQKAKTPAAAKTVVARSLKSYSY